VADPGIPKGDAEEGVCPQWGPGAEPRWGSGGEAPQKLRTLCDIRNSQQSKTSIQRQHDKNRTNLAQEIKHAWSSQSELVNDFDRFDWRRLRMYVD